MLDIKQSKKINLNFRKYIKHYLSNKFDEITRDQIYQDVSILIRNQHINSLIFAVIDKSNYKICDGLKITYRLNTFDRPDDEFPELKYNSTIHDMIIIAELTESFLSRNKDERQKILIKDRNNSWNYLSEPEMEINEIELHID